MRGAAGAEAWSLEATVSQRPGVSLLSATAAVIDQLLADENGHVEQLSEGVEGLNPSVLISKRQCLSG